jgi:hypothetical protein
MSLEQHIQELNGNILALIGALQEIGSKTEITSDIPVDVVVVPMNPPTTAGQKAKPAGAPEPVAKEVTFDHVKKAVLNLAARDRKLAVALLEKHGAKKVGELDPASYVAVEFEALALLGE